MTAPQLRPRAPAPGRMPGDRLERASAARFPAAPTGDRGLHRLWYRLQQRTLAGTSWPASLARLLGGQRRLRVVEHEVDLAGPGLPRATLRIGFASDFHAGPITHPALLARACDALAAIRPDLLLLGGDFVSLDASAIGPLAARLGQVPAPLGRFAVLGNHDYWNGARLVAERLEASGIRVLRNEAVTLPAPYQGIVLCGLDDDLAGVPEPLASFAPRGIRLLLMHGPSGLLAADGAPFALALCGHTHGGQIALPGGRPILLPPGPLSRRYPAGRYQPGPGRTLIVSRGVGYSTVPVRAFSPSEVVLCHLRLSGTAGPERSG